MSLSPFRSPESRRGSPIALLYNQQGSLPIVKGVHTGAGVPGAPAVALIMNLRAY